MQLQVSDIHTPKSAPLHPRSHHVSRSLLRHKQAKALRKQLPPEPTWASDTVYLRAPHKEGSPPSPRAPGRGGTRGPPSPL